MHSSHLSPAAPAAPLASRRPLALALVGLVAALAAGGLFIAVDLIRHGPAHGPNLPSGPFKVSDDAPTSFGIVSIEHAEKVRGLTGRDLAGRTHGVADVVTADKVRVQASATLTNTQQRTSSYSPSQFSIVATKGDRPAAADKRLSAVSSSVEPGTLQPDASIDARLSFVVPRDHSRLWIEFREPGRPQPVLVDLGRADAARTTRSTDDFDGKDYSPTRDGHEGHQETR